MGRQLTILLILCFAHAPVAVRLLSAEPTAPSDGRRYSSAMARARAENTMVALVLTARDPVEPGLAALFCDPAVEKALAATAVLFLPADRNPAVVSRHGVERFPAVVFVDGWGREAGRVAAPSSPAAFAGEAAQIATAFAWSSCAHRAAALDPRGLDAARVSLDAADQLLSAGKPQEAEEGYASALRGLRRPDGRGRSSEESSRGRAVLGLALSARALGRLEDAERILGAALDGGGGDPALRGLWRERALFVSGQVQLERGETDAARGRFADCASEFRGSRYGERARRYLDGAPAAAPLAFEVSSSR